MLFRPKEPSLICYETDGDQVTSPSRVIYAGSGSLDLTWRNRRLETWEFPVVKAEDEG